MNDPICIMLMGVLIGTAIHDPICKFMNHLHDLYWKDKICSCKNCKWSYELDSFLICSARSDNHCTLAVSEDNLCEKWEEVQK